MTSPLLCPGPARAPSSVTPGRPFSRTEQAIRALDEDQFHHVVKDLHGADWEQAEIGDMLMDWLKHANRHLGMIECLVGVQGLRGTATR